MPTVRYTVLDGEVIAEKRNGVRKEYVPDPLGSTTALLDSTQTVTDSFSYWPYGEEQNRTGSTTTPFEYVGTQGYYRDSSTKTYVRARYLNTQHGRWMTSDPIGFRGGINSYRYGSSNPTTYIDPTGMKPCPIWPRLSCFACYYLRLVRGGADPEDSCRAAAARCGVTGEVICAGITLPPPPPPGPPSLPPWWLPPVGPPGMFTDGDCKGVCYGIVGGSDAFKEGVCGVLCKALCKAGCDKGLETCEGIVDKEWREWCVAIVVDLCKEKS